jgi:hypothetical protein
MRTCSGFPSAVTALVSSILVCAAAYARFGTIVVPAAAMMDMKEGTIEAWVRFDFDPDHKSDLRWQSIASLAYIEIPEAEGDAGGSIHVGWGMEKATRHDRTTRRTTFRVAFIKEGKQIPHPALAVATPMGKGKWHHVAVTWKDGRYVRLYLNGEEAGRRDLAWSAERDIPSNARLVIGWPGYIHDNAIAVDEIRLSSIARKPEDMGFHHAPLKPDPFTLYLEDFGHISRGDGKLTTQPFRVDADDEPLPIEGGAIVPGKYGNAYAFNPKPVPEKGRP